MSNNSYYIQRFNYDKTDSRFSYKFVLFDSHNIKQIKNGSCGTDSHRIIINVDKIKKPR